MTMCCESIQWIKKKRKVFDKRRNKMVDQSFLRLNINNDYNEQMRDADISDQIQLSYCIDR